MLVPKERFRQLFLDDRSRERTEEYPLSLALPPAIFIANSLKS